MLHLHPAVGLFFGFLMVVTLDGDWPFLFKFQFIDLICTSVEDILKSPEKCGLYI